MATDNKSTPLRVDAGIGIFWFIGWLFTIAFAKLIWWQAILALVVWPYSWPSSQMFARRLIQSDIGPLNNPRS
jgi:hypothetical protein